MSGRLFALGFVLVLACACQSENYYHYTGTGAEISYLEPTSNVQVLGLSSVVVDREEPLRVSVMTFNIRNGYADDGSDSWENRALLVFKVADRHGGDFIGLQEAWRFQIDEFQAALPGYTCVGRGRLANPLWDEWNPICYATSRWEIDPIEKGVLWLSTTPTEPGSTSWGSSFPRIVTWARFVDKTTGRGVYIYNTHLDHNSGEARFNGAKLISELIANRARTEDPAILLGDLNVGERDKVIRYLNGENNKHSRSLSPAPLIDTFRVRFPNERTVGTFGDFDGDRRGDKLDYIFVERSFRFEVESAAIIRDNENGRYPSDHYPVKATVEFSPMDRPPE